jgi:ACS family glucarate transporter-like MFS transporter
VSLLLDFSIVSYILRVNITIAGEPLMHEFRLTPLQLGWIFSAFLISYTGFMTPAGAWADRFGPRLLLGLAGLGWAVLTLLTALLPGLVFGSTAGILGSLLALRFLLGICEAPTYPGAGRAIAHWVSRSERAFSNAVVIAGALFGSAVTAPAVSYLMVHLGWRSAMVLISIVAPSLVLVWLLYATDQPRQHRAVNAQELDIIGTLGPHLRQNTGGWRTVLKSGQACRLFAAYGCECYLSYLFIWWVYIYFVEVRKFSLVRGGLVTAAPFILSTFTTPAAGAGLVLVAVTDHIVAVAPA